MRTPALGTLTVRRSALVPVRPSVVEHRHRVLAADVARLTVHVQRERVDPLQPEGRVVQGDPSSPEQPVQASDRPRVSVDREDLSLTWKEGLHRCRCRTYPSTTSAVRPGTGSAPPSPAGSRGPEVVRTGARRYWSYEMYSRFDAM